MKVSQNSSCPARTVKSEELGKPLLLRPILWEWNMDHIHRNSSSHGCSPGLLTDNWHLLCKLLALCAALEIPLNPQTHFPVKGDRCEKETHQNSTSYGFQYWQKDQGSSVVLGILEVSVFTLHKAMAKPRILLSDQGFQYLEDFLGPLSVLWQEFLSIIIQGPLLNICQILELLCLQRSPIRTNSSIPWDPEK